MPIIGILPVVEQIAMRSRDRHLRLCTEETGEPAATLPIMPVLSVAQVLRAGCDGGLWEE